VERAKQSPWNRITRSFSDNSALQWQDLSPPLGR
jgi:hypothetical protein